MPNSPITVEINSLAVFLMVCVAGFVLWLAKYLFGKLQDHETRIQSIEDIQGTKLDNLEKKIDKIELSIEALSANIHKEKNAENQLVQAVTNLNKFLERQFE